MFYYSLCKSKEEDKKILRNEIKILHSKVNDCKKKLCEVILLLKKEEIIFYFNNYCFLEENNLIVICKEYRLLIL